MNDYFLRKKDNYLWDTSSAPDPGDVHDLDVVRLEQLLTRFRAPSAETLPLTETVWKDRSWRNTVIPVRREWLAIAAMVALAIGGVWLSIGGTRTGLGNWRVTRIAGRPLVGYESVGENLQMRPGDVLVTNESSRARIDAGNIGEVDVDPDSSVRLLEAQPASGSLGLDHGTIKALIWAPPRRFTVRTQFATAVDLGCEYTLHVDPDGNGWMRVSIGWVAFEKDGRESFVPVDAMSLIRKDAGPGTPFYEDASESFRTALEVVDFGALNPADGEARSAALTTVLEQARRRDAITLWHLLARTEGADLALIYDRLAQLVPPPHRVTRDGILAGNSHMRDLWWDALGLGDTEWWRDWKQDFPVR